MASNLKSRLQRIRNTAQSETPKPVLPPPEDEPRPSGFPDEWQPLRYKVLKRSVISNLQYDILSILPEEMKILVPDFSQCNKKMIHPGDVVFFDLETTGLSGGAGTLAFLAAIGFFIPSEKMEHDPQNHLQNYRLQIDQYLLLDYPGEADFLEALIPCLHNTEKVIVTYNGKSFDTKLFRTRCLMNGIKPPVYHEADLLHPARRLWKRILPNCSQAEIETSILTLDRTGDISGAFAPQIWFDFLNSQLPSDLLKVCGHNKKDIEGLASIFSSITEIASEPLNVLSNYRFDIEAVALRWRDAARYFSDNSLLQNQAETLLTFCVNEKHPKAMYLRGYDLLKNGFYNEGIALLNEILNIEIAPSLKISVCNSLAIDAEWRLKDMIQALNYTDALLQIENMSESFRNKTEQRRKRLLTKLSF